ncbi:hypothetical protein GWI33_011909 [Rhynchophorus ferrugineus]|uniref:Uncharacterized protein n=1 Tax=Rhynchophorus ferrugineus TaxID=354439 RepID=A0A834MIJ9_RHYFE|nr:hypothetical protein GWI33_011909 [Rhynchophorus ferrugineus]
MIHLHQALNLAEKQIRVGDETQQTEKNRVIKYKKEINSKFIEPNNQGGSSSEIRHISSVNEDSASWLHQNILINSLLNNPMMAYDKQLNAVPLSYGNHTVSQWNSYGEDPCQSLLVSITGAETHYGSDFRYHSTQYPIRSDENSFSYFTYRAEIRAGYHEI